MSRIVVIFLLLAALLLSACNGTNSETQSAVVGGQQISVPGGVYTDITVAELQAMLANKDFTFVNVHNPFEGNIANTDLSIAYNGIEQNLSQLPADKAAKIVLYCRSDRMSNIAAKTLVGLGYTNVWNLDGGMVAWEQAGLPIER
jgi:rhodanese-related sulfurtransferase